MFRPAPRASGYFRTDYAQDLALAQTRSEQVSLAIFVAVLAVSLRCIAFRARSPARCSWHQSARCR